MSNGSMAQAAAPAPAAPAGRRLTLDALLTEIERAKDPVVAVSITGGGASGAFQAGALKALVAALRTRPGPGRSPATPRMIIGTSAGALNAFGLLLDFLQSSDGGGLEGDGEAEPCVASLWRVIGGRNDGSKFVTGRRALLVRWATRYLRSPRIRRVAGLVALLAATALLNPVLCGMYARTSNVSALRWVGNWIGAHPVAATAICASLLLVVAIGVVLMFGRALFKNEALESTLAAAAGAVLDGRTPARAELERLVPAERREQMAIRLARAWHAKANPPELIVTATDLTASWECLFALASRRTCERLASRRWEVARIGESGGTPAQGTAGYAAAVAESQLLRCVVASTSIPGVFPSQRIELHPLDHLRKSVAHDFVDGGVLNNAPVHVAADAGATHVISIELDPLSETLPLDAGDSDGAAEPGIIGNVAMTFSTLLNLATTEDVYRTADTNRLLASASRPGEVVEVYRLAPERRDLGTLEFDGHYRHAMSAPSPSLVQWLEKGTVAVGRGEPFWVATHDAWPRSSDAG